MSNAVATASTQNQDLVGAISELKEQLNGVSPKVVIYFSSSQYSPEGLAKGMKESFPSAEVFGCTTSGEIISGKMLDGAIVAMALGEGIVKTAKIASVKGIGEGIDLSSLEEAAKEMGATGLRDLDHNKIVGIILTDGLSGSEERVMDRLGDATDITIIGASAGDDLKFQQTHVFVQGEALSDAFVLCLLEPENGFEIIKTQSFEVLDKTLIVDKATVEARTVHSFNGKPAKQAYAEAIGVSPDEVDKFFMRHPVGLLIDGQPFVRSPQRLEGDDMVFFCNVQEGMNLSLLKSGDIVQDTEKAMSEAFGQLAEKPKAIIDFHCILRALELRDKKLTDDYGQLHESVPTIGFCTYGEALVGHINQTSTMLLLK